MQVDKHRVRVFIELLVSDLTDEKLMSAEDLEWSLRHPERISHRLRQLINVDRQAELRAELREAARKMRDKARS